MPEVSGMKASQLKRGPLAKGTPIEPHVGAYVALLRSANLTVGARLLLLIIKSYYNRRTHLACPSYDTLMDDMGSNRRSIAKWLSELESHGLIVRFKNGDEKFNRYHLLDDDYAVAHSKLAKNTAKSRQITSGKKAPRTSGKKDTVTNSRNQRCNPKIIQLPPGAVSA